ncbi:hypothetical protein [Variovorax soli]|uniref:hypothetical protein n=1 Tax=Variovorax soli TaxID=376815 RepID=UPI000839B0DD|nr:hypothetical protein [Variovorax soli]
MPTEPQQRLTPQQRLAVSRHALMSQLQGSEASGQRASERPSFLNGVSWAPVARGVARHWWQRHPLHAAGQLARPVLEKYAREEPLKLVAVAAAVGAAVVLTRPWRLLSASALVATTFKTSELAGVVNALMQRKTSPRKDSP